MTVLRCEDPECAELRKEFAVPFLNSWVVVLDGKGETLASWMGDGAGAGCTEHAADRFPRNLARLIHKSLERTETVEELERRWRSRPHDGARFEALALRLREMFAHGKLRQCCLEAAANPRLTPLQRDDYRIQALNAWASDHSHQERTRKARAAFVREGEQLLVELAGHPRVSELVGALFSRGYAHTFDVPGKCARAIARLAKAARQAADPDSLKKRIQELADMRDKWVAHQTEALQRITEQSFKDYFAAILGDARAAIRLCSRPPYSEHAEYREWLREAKRKRQRERKRQQAR